MVNDRLRDGRRIAQLLASEIEGDAGALADLTVTDAKPDVEPTVDGALAYRVARDGAAVAAVFVQPERARVEFRAGRDAAAAAASGAGLPVRPKASEPPRTLVFLPDGAAVKRVLAAFEAAIGSSPVSDPDSGHDPDPDLDSGPSPASDGDADPSA